MKSQALVASRQSSILAIVLLLFGFGPSVVVTLRAQSSQPLLTNTPSWTLTGALPTPINGSFINATAYSADASKWFAAGAGYEDIPPYGTSYLGHPYFSSNSGATWVDEFSAFTGSLGLGTNFTGGDWYAAAMSADGSKIYTVGWYQSGYFTADAGATWQPGGGASQYMTYVACSADGTKAAEAAAINGEEYQLSLYFTTNSNSSWSTMSGPVGGIDVSPGAWAMSADGNLVAIAQSGTWVTSNYGGPPNAFYSQQFPNSNWVQVIPPGNLVSSAVPINGEKIIAPCDNGIYVGTGFTATATGNGIDPYNYNTSWVSTNMAPTTNYSLQASADGTHLLATTSQTNGFYTSSDSGVTWIWNSAAVPGNISQDGSKLIAEVAAGATEDIYMMPFPTLTPQVQSVNVQSGNFKMAITTVTGVTYQPQSSADLANWKNLGSPIAGTGTPITISDPATNSVRFYRVNYTTPGSH